MEEIGNATKPNPALLIVFEMAIIANTVDKGFGLVPLIPAEKQLQMS